MKHDLKRYLPLLFALPPVALGAVMPWLSAAFQDARMGNSQESLELNAVSLTLLQDDGVEQALRIISSEFATIPWTGGTALSKTQALRAAEDVLDEMRSFGLLSSEDRHILSKTGGTAEPCLIVAGDGSSALVWNCRWDVGEWASSCSITVDDVSGKAVRISTASLVNVYGESAKAGSVQVDGTELREEYYILLDLWVGFLTSYYDANLLTVTEPEDISEKGAKFLLNLELHPDKSPQTCRLPLELSYNEVRFNF